MIPPHRPAFGLATILASTLTNQPEGAVAGLEAAFAEASGCAAAVWLPSARSGICWALRAASGPETRILGPAFTCNAVHEAMIRAGGLPVVLDAGNEGFLMDYEKLVHSQNGKNALVLCEVYGHPYDLAQLTRNAPERPVVRIVDMAMSVPHETLFRRLEANDFAVISFGPGKSMYAGWGAIAFARNRELAREVVRLRDASVTKGTLELRLKRAAEISLRTLAQYPAIFTLVKRMRAQSIALPKVEDRAPAIFPAAWAEDATKDRHWRLSSTRLDRNLALWNLRHSALLHERRLLLAKRYDQNLRSSKEVEPPPSVEAALSDYTVRVAPHLRAPVQRRLFNAGINAITLWDFSRYLNRDQFPNAFRLSSQVLNLPLSPWMTLEQVDQICEVLVRCVSQASSASSQSA